MLIVKAFYSIMAMLVYVYIQSIFWYMFCVVSTGKDFFGPSKTEQRQAHNLLVHVCDCLYRCFLYDTEGFVTKERSDTLLQPLVDQVTHTAIKLTSLKVSPTMYNV